MSKFEIITKQIIDYYTCKGHVCDYTLELTLSPLICLDTSLCQRSQQLEKQCMNEPYHFMALDQEIYRKNYPL